MGKPNNLSTKIWQMMQSNSTKCVRLESDLNRNSGECISCCGTKRRKRSESGLKKSGLEELSTLISDILKEWQDKETMELLGDPDVD